MTINTKNLLCFFVSIFILIVILNFFSEGKELFEKIRHVGIVHFIPQFLLIFCANVINSYLSVSLIGHFGLKLPLKEWLPLGFVNSLSNLIFPAKTGTMVKAIYLKEKYQFPITHNYSLVLFTTFLSYINLFILTGTMLMFISLFWYEKISIINAFFPRLSVPFFNVLLIGIFLFAAFGSSALLIFRAIRFYKTSCNNNISKKMKNTVASLIEGANHLSSNSQIIFKIFICSTVGYFIRFGMLYCGFLAVNISLDITQLVLINLIFSIQGFVSLLPGNIGIQEVSLTISSGIVGASFAEGFIVAAIIRVTSLIEIFLFGLISYQVLNVGSILKNSAE